MTASDILTLDHIHVVHTARTGKLFKPDKVHAVNDVSLSIRRGETIGVVGESGCGKSTLARVIVGLQQPTEGDVLYRGRSVLARNAATRRELGKAVSIVFQDPSTALNARMTIHDILRDPLDVHGIGTAAQRERRILGPRPEAERGRTFPLQ